MLTVSPNEAKNLLTDLPPGARIELKLPTGEVMVLAVKEQTEMTKDDILKERFSHLMGRPITVSEAADKYNVPRGSVQEWKEKGYLKILGEDYPAVVSEADVAYCAEIYHQRKVSGFGFRGVPLLDDNGLAYELKRPDVAEYRRRKKQS